MLTQTKDYRCVEAFSRTINILFLSNDKINFSPYVRQSHDSVFAEVTVHLLQPHAETTGDFFPD